jgi:hypothetical protein
MTVIRDAIAIAAAVMAVVIAAAEAIAIAAAVMAVVIAAAAAV